MFDKFLKGLSEEGKKKLSEISEKASNVDIDLKKSATKEQERERTLSEKYAGYDDASDAKKKRIENRNKRRQERYAEAKKNTDAKRERYAEKMVSKGIVASKEEARGRFDNVRGITRGSAIKREALMNMQTGNKPASFEKYLNVEKPEIEEDSSNIAGTVAYTNTGNNTTTGSIDY